MIALEAKTLYSLIFNEENKVPNIEGNTPLVLKAIQNSKFENLSREKELCEDEVCSIVKHFNQFNQVHFSELDSYISISKFNMQKILSAFSAFVKKVETNEDIYLKGCVLKFIQSYNKSSFQLDYIKKRFHDLKENNSWLYAELLINVSWEEGVSQISEILKMNNDTSFLFVLITNWMSSGISETNMIMAFEIWSQFLSKDDLNLLKEFCNQYSYSIKFDRQLNLQKDGNIIQSIINSDGLKEFKKSKSHKKFESIPS